MKLRINGFNNEVLFDEECVHILTIKDSKCFSHLIGILNDKINGLESNEIFLLDDKEEELKLEKNAYMILDVFNIDYNSKKILSKIYDIISENIKKNQNYVIENIALNLRNYIISEINELPFEFTMKSELDIPEILKIYNLKIDGEMYHSILEKIELLIDLLATLKISNILIIPNLKSFLGDVELVELYKYSLYNNINLLIIERNSYDKLEYESNMIIDENFDDFFI